MLCQLKMLGINLSIDDFGTGFSSLNYLRSLPIDLIKIDQSFIRDITKNNKDEAIITTIISLAHHLNLKVIAEGVEEEQQVNFLKRHNCDQVQGYYFSKPLAPSDCEKMLQAATINQYHSTHASNV